jgi:CheY-like chemotaxis protein
MTSWMVVEDEPDLYDLILALYEMLGVDGISFTTGEGAVAWIEDVDEGNLTDNLPEVALIDIRLPGTTNGIMIAERLRQSPVLSGIRIILATAYRLTAKEEHEAMQRSGGDYLMYKPLPSLEEFNRIMRGG